MAGSEMSPGLLYSVFGKMLLPVLIKTSEQNHLHRGSISRHSINFSSSARISHLLIGIKIFMKVHILPSTHGISESAHLALSEIELICRRRSLR